jgi:hypothetical protein
MQGLNLLQEEESHAPSAPRCFSRRTHSSGGEYCWQPLVLHYLAKLWTVLSTSFRGQLQYGGRQFGDFVVEAPGRGLVQLNLPEHQRSKVRGIACYTGDTGHRELGTAQQHPDQDSELNNLGSA